MQRLTCWLLGLALLASPADLEGRAGGGQSFGRSSSSSSRSYSSGSSRSYSSGSSSSGWGSSSSRSSSSGSWSWGSSSSSSSRNYSSSSSSSSSYGNSRSSDSIEDLLPWNGVRKAALWVILGGLMLGLFMRLLIAVDNFPERFERLAGAVGGVSYATALSAVPMIISPVAMVITLPMYGPWLFDAFSELASALTEVPEARAVRAQHAPVAAKPAVSAAEMLRLAMERLCALDPNFSRPLFMDFVGLLHARVVQARASGDPEPVRAYVRQALLDSWRRADPVKIDEIVLGAASITRIRVPPQGPVKLTLQLEASWLETAKGGPPRRVAVAERWFLERARTVLSRGPRPTQSLGCPSCGASGDLSPTGACTYCGNVVTNGAFDWRLERIEQTGRDVIDVDPALRASGEEVGTDEPTVFDPDVVKQERLLAARHPEYSWEAFEAFARETFVAVQTAWTDGDLAKLRGLESHALWSTHRFWIERYERAGLRNVLEQVVVERVQKVRCELDPFYESITVRIFASMCDSTRDARGTVVAGNEGNARAFSEYWTFIAAIGTVTGKDEKCPACGAPMTLAMAGRCEHCDALIVAGRFGWVLSRIEQDEAYGG